MSECIGKSISIILGKKGLIGKVVKVNRNGKLKIKTGEFEDWDIHPSLIKNNKVVVNEYRQKQTLNEFEIHTKKIKVTQQ